MEEKRQPDTDEKRIPASAGNHAPLTGKELLGVADGGEKAQKREKRDELERDIDNLGGG